MSGASNFVTLARVTLPLIIPAMTIVLMLSMVRKPEPQRRCVIVQD